MSDSRKIVYYGDSCTGFGYPILLKKNCESVMRNCIINQGI